jgi:LPS O-antigen subunit length determinant protein (WzzB/FepE family)
VAPSETGANEDRNQGLVGLDGEIDLFEVSRTLWAGRWLIVGVALACACFGAAYGWLATPWYRAEVVLIAAENRSEQGLAAQLSQVGGLAGLAGINLASVDKAEPLAILKSRDFAANFIEQRQLMTVLFASQWDSTEQRWRSRADRVPDIRDAVDFFDKYVRRVSEDRKTGLVSLVIEWRDAEAAATWANEMATEINRQTRERALEIAAANIAYLQSEMRATSVVSLQQAIGRLLESEMQKLMLARGNEEFAFRVIDKARVPKRSFKPRPVVAIVGASAVGSVLCMFFLLARESYRRRGRRD